MITIVCKKARERQMHYSVQRQPQPKMEQPPNSKIARKYVSFVDKRLKTATEWLKCKRNDDNVGSLWRVHDDLYDLTDFVDRHPGGASWLTMTQGTDITEAFETHHINMAKVLPVLSKYRVGPAEEPRNIKLTFEENGFYKTLKRRVVKRMEEVEPQKRQWLSDLILDILLVANIAAAVICTYYPWFVLPSGLLMMWLVIGAHNYLHMADNFRMYYFNIGFLSFHEWRVSHALSHHLFTNSRVDMEMTVMEPLINWWPTPEGKFWWNRYGVWVYEWFLYPIMFFRDFITRTAIRLIGGERPLELPDLVPFVLPVAMYLFGAGSLWHVLRVWVALVCSGSLIFGATAINGGHHHPELFQDGDEIRNDLDWGLFQMDTMIDRSSVKQANRFAVLTQFGNHILHHLFPTLDHGYLNELYGPLHETLSEFATANARELPFSQLIFNQHLQMARVKPSTHFAKM